MTLKAPRGIDLGWDRNPDNYDDAAPALRKALGLHPHEKIRHDRLQEGRAHFMGGTRVKQERRRGRSSHIFDDGIDT